MLLAWYERTAADLPWRASHDAYRVWLSEIMLQQTQVSTVLAYYPRFLARFADVAQLAAASEDEVLALWSGLGYYSRARHLHRCAREVLARHGGQFPRTAAELATLPGIGRSTAAAIAAFCFGERAAILDGNVKRVLTRALGFGDDLAAAHHERALWARAEALLPTRDPHRAMPAYTQGLMDLGASVCSRRRPDCARCPLAETCVARREQRQHLLPMPRPKKAIPERNSVFFIISDGHGVLLARRPPSGIWGGLLVPPEGDAASLVASLGVALDEAEDLPVLSHTFTHFRLHIEPRLIRVARPPLLDQAAWHWLPLGDIEGAALPTPMRKLLLDVRRIMPAASAAD